MTLILAQTDGDEISLFNSEGKPVAYIAEELTIYLWSGKPVAYLDEDSSGGFHVSLCANIVETPA